MNTVKKEYYAWLRPELIKGFAKLTDSTILDSSKASERLANSPDDPAFLGHKSSTG
jgi:hypothetical protein